MTREEAIKIVKENMHLSYDDGNTFEALKTLVPEFREESEDEKLRKYIIKCCEECIETNGKGLELSMSTTKKLVAYLEKQKENIEKEYVFRPLAGTDINSAALQAIRRVNKGDSLVLAFNGAYIPVRKGCNANKIVDIYDAFIKKQKEQKQIKLQVYEVGKGTTICGQDYKCKKDYKAGNCWYIKDVIYHCGRDGFLTDQNGISWSCTPEWFKEYIYSNAEWAEKEKSEFVGGQFIQCNCTLDNGLKKGEHYWLEYVGDDTYVGRSDNILNQKFHITPRQLFTLFTQQLEEKQKEQKPISQEDFDTAKHESLWGEQKSAEWTLPKDFEEAVYKVANFISPFDNQEELRKTSHRFAEQLLSLAKKELDKSAEWSEEDKNKVAQYLHDRDGGMLWSKATEIASDILDMLCPCHPWKPMEEQPEVDLEKVLSGFTGYYAHENSGEYPSAIDIARHFYELGKKNSK